MNRNKNCIWQIWILVAAMCAMSANGVDAQDAKIDSGEDEFAILDYPIAILPFKTRGKEAEGMGEKISDLMFAQLVVDPDLQLVEREDLEKVLSEAELNLSGLVRPDEAIQIGSLTGAKLLVTGSVFHVDDQVYVVSKIIGTETSRVVGASAKGAVGGKLDVIVEKVGQEIIASIKKNSSRLVAEQVDEKSRIAAIKEGLEGVKLPKVFVSIEERHIGRSTFDPAAQTEMILILRECGFEVIDPDTGNKSQADVVITGEGISEYATRTGNLISVKARLEVKAVQRKSDTVIAVDRQTRLAVDLGEQLAGKQALQHTSRDIVERLIPAIAKSVK